MDAPLRAGRRHQRRPLARRRHGAGRGGAVKETWHGVHRATSQGRPVVVVTGMGVVTSLGAGKADNWAKLTAGESGIRAITRFATEGLKTTHRRHRRFRAGRAVLLDHARRAARRHGRRGSDRAGRRSAARAIFPDRCFSRSRRSRSNGRSARRSPARAAPTTPSPMTTSCAAPAPGRFHAIPRALPVRLGRRPSGRPVRHQGLADLAVDRLRLGRHRDPARRRGDPPRRRPTPRSASAPTARSIRNR